MTAARYAYHRTALAALVLTTAASLGLAACAAGSAPRASAGGAPVSGGTAYFAEQPLTPPTYIFPLVSGQYFTTANTNDLQTLLYLPLYWYGDRGTPAIDYRLSIGAPPVYTDGNRV